jgi:hypothetical protein
MTDLQGYNHPIPSFKDSNSLRGQMSWRPSLLTILYSPAILVETQSVATPRATWLGLSTERAHSTYTHLRVRGEAFLARVRVLSRVCITVARGWTSGLLATHQTCEVPKYISCRARSGPTSSGGLQSCSRASPPNTESLTCLGKHSRMVLRVG